MALLKSPLRFTHLKCEISQARLCAGTFNQSKQEGLKLEGPDDLGDYRTKVRLMPGVHEYKFVNNCKIWRNDPGNPDVVGAYFNSVLRIPE